MTLLTETFAARHSMDSPEWYTPSDYVEAARTAMGGIHLDPASHVEANTTIKAVQFFDEEQDGLAHEWWGNVFLNPPGGKRGKVSLPNLFWAKLMREWNHARIAHAVWIGYSLEQLQTLQNAETPWSPIDFSICIPRKRIAFVENAAMRSARQAKEIAAGKPATEKASPSHANYITYLGNRREEFAVAFKRFGQVVIR